MKFTLISLLLAMVVLATNATEEARPNCVCTREFAPVCATDGVTYSNKCEFRCAKGLLRGRAADELKITRGGACDGPEIPLFAQEELK